MLSNITQNVNDAIYLVKTAIFCLNQPDLLTATSGDFCLQAANKLQPYNGDPNIANIVISLTDAAKTGDESHLLNIMEQLDKCLYSDLETKSNDNKIQDELEESDYDKLASVDTHCDDLFSSGATGTKINKLGPGSDKHGNNALSTKYSFESVEEVHARMVNEYRKIKN